MSSLDSIQYKYEAIEDCASDMRRTTNEISNKAELLISQADKLMQDGWAGDAADGYRREVGELRNNLNTARDFLTEKEQQVREASANMQETDRNAAKGFA
ncbi:WXG100 family type VII secretion target [Amycolatopsis sp. cmx-4-54]|uniref:WXG100 family type VII secretion target n=1 Tax=Amycolatopsis sp. cmx-4-54 TaxID=2790936 RepID=UPI00397B1462